MSTYAVGDVIETVVPPSGALEHDTRLCGSTHFWRLQHMRVGERSAKQPPGFIPVSEIWYTVLMPDDPRVVERVMADARRKWTPSQELIDDWKEMGIEIEPLVEEPPCPPTK